MKIFLLAAMQLFFISAFCQTNTYTATVLDVDNQPVSLVTVNEAGTQNYTTTNDAGIFNLRTEAKNFTLIFSSIGFQTFELPVVNGNIPLIINLNYSAEELDAVVITALGIEKDRQSLVSSVSIVTSEELTEVPLNNIVNSLAGQVAGVQITNGSSGVGSSSRIVIRGENSLSGSNQPLFVVDGVPISNEQITSDLVNNGYLQEVDYGNGGAELSPDDIASISILKGGASAALYGARAANGVVVITTKRGEDKKGLGVSTSSLVTFESLLTLPEYQNKYGGGSNGEYSFQNGIGAGVNDGGISSYGPLLDSGLLINQFDSPSVDINGNPVRAGDVISRTYADGTFTPIQATPWISHKNNVRDFFKTGVTFQNNLAITSATDKTKMRLSYSNLRNEGILPNTDLDRDGLAISLDHNLNEKLSVHTFVNYINTRSTNRPNLGYGYENILYGFNWTARNTNINSLRDYWQPGQEGVQHFDLNYLWLTNPYLTLYENTNGFNKNRVLGNVSAEYEISEHLNLIIRGGLDYYSDKRDFRRAFSTNRNPFGSYREDNVKYREVNNDILLSYDDKISDDIKFNISAGANRFDQEINYNYTEATQLALPAIYTLANSRTPLVGVSNVFRKRINSVYGTGNISFKNQLYVDVSYRNDWSSTLPADNNSFGYYSGGLSYVISNSFELPKPISYLKLRLSAASVGNDTDPYQNQQNFLFNQNYGSNFIVTTETVLKNANLKPERLTTYEAGLEYWMFNGRFQLDATVYQNTSKDQIISRPISTASGYFNSNENGGEVRTRGLELLVSGVILKSQNFQWKSSVNFTQYESIVTELPEGVDQFVTAAAKIFDGGGGSNSVFYIAREGGRVGDMYGTGFVKIDGQTLYSNGLPVQDGTLRKLGNYNPDYIVGFNNKFSYKNVDLAFLFDWRQGGTIVSRIKALGSTSGVLLETLDGRETGIVGEGVKNIGTAENPNYVTNDINVPASSYYNTFYDRGNEESALYSATYVKLRQLSIYYNFSKNVSNKIGFDEIKIGLIGSNLLLFTENPHFDPELNSVQERKQVFGVDNFSYPSSRSYGFSIKTQF